MNIAIFVSGSGTNCENLIKYFAGSESVNCALVVSNKFDAYALVRAENLGVPTAVTPKAELNNPDVMMPLLKKYGIDFIVLAGFLPLVPSFLIDASVHWVTPVCDSGEIIAQYKVAISPNDTADDIAEKEHQLEMKYFPKVVEEVLKKL